MSSSQSNYNTQPTRNRSLALRLVYGDTLDPFLIAVRIGVTTEGSPLLSHCYKPLAKHVEFTFRKGLCEAPSATAVVG